jgi:hypothetical protein
VSAFALLATGLRRATRWRLLVLLAVGSAVPAALATLPIWGFLSGLLDHATQAPEVLYALESSWFPDLAHALSERRAAEAIPAGMLGAIALAALLAPALAGATVAEVTSGERLRFRGLLEGAGRWYGRMLRTAVAGAVPLGLAGVVVAGIAKLVEKGAERALTEAAATGQARQAILWGGAIVWAAHVTLDAGRARLAANPARRSAFLAWLSGTWLVVRNPIRAGAVGLAGIVLGVGGGLVVMAIRQRLPAGPAWSTAAGVLLAQVAAAAVGWGRAVRLGGLTALAREDDERRYLRRERTKNAPAAATASPSTA